MQTNMRSAADQTRQAEQRALARAPLMVAQQASVDDHRAETAGLQALQTTINASQRQQGIATLRETLNASPQQHGLLAAQAKMNGNVLTHSILGRQTATSAGAQLHDIAAAAPVQDKFRGQVERSQAATAPAPGTVAQKTDHAGLPDPLKAGIASLSGMSMDHVKVHYNSEKPAQLAAHAYAQGSEIHVGPGQEQHLPHEAWHVVQQAQGRVRPTLQMKVGMVVNDDKDLEAEADVMGERALQGDPFARQAEHGISNLQSVPVAAPALSAGPAQLLSRYENTRGNKVHTAFLALKSVAEQMGTSILPEADVEDGIVRIGSSPIEYGVFDLADEQHLIKLYYDIQKQLAHDQKASESTVPITDQETAARKITAKRNTEGDSFDVAFLGAGASVAYDIVSRGTGFDSNKGIIIGPLQPWDGQRGPGVVAHPEHMISPIRHFLGSAIDDTWLKRERFSELIREVFIRSKMKWVPETVSSITRPSGGYEITVGDGKKIHARNVVSGIGVGAHKPPESIEPENIALRKDDIAPQRRVMSMDVFTQVASRLRKVGAEGLGVAEAGIPDEENASLTVVLSGANGGIDVAFDALNRGYKVHWIVGNGGASFLEGFPNYAAYLPYLRKLNEIGKLGKAKVDDFQSEHARVERVLPDLYEQQDAMFRGVAEKFKSNGFAGVYFGRMTAVTADSRGVAATVPTFPIIRGDILVYAQGQGEGNFELFKEFIPALKPEQDRDRRFTDDGDTALGLTTGDGSLKIIGAMAYRLGATIQASSGEMVDVLGRLNDAIEHISEAWKPDHMATSEFYKAFFCYSRLINAVRDVQKNKEDDAMLKQRSEAKKNFIEAMSEVDAQLRPFQREKISPVKRTALNRLQNAFGEAKLHSGSIADAMRPVIDSQPRNVLLNDQLTPTRSQIEAVHGFVPFNIGQQANFATDDRTTVAIHISAKYPGLSDYDPALVQEITACIVAGRRKVAATPVVFDGVSTALPTYTPEPPNGRKYQLFWSSALSRIEASIQDRTRGR